MQGNDANSSRGAFSLSYVSNENGVQADVSADSGSRSTSGTTPSRETQPLIRFHNMLSRTVPNEEIQTLFHFHNILNTSVACGDDAGNWRGEISLRDKQEILTGLSWASYPLAGSSTSQNVPSCVYSFSQPLVCITNNVLKGYKSGKREAPEEGPHLTKRVKLYSEAGSSREEAFPAWNNLSTSSSSNFAPRNYMDVQALVPPICQPETRMGFPVIVREEKFSASSNVQPPAEAVVGFTSYAAPGIPVNSTTPASSYFHNSSGPSLSMPNQPSSKQRDESSRNNNLVYGPSNRSNVDFTLADASSFQNGPSPLVEMDEEFEQSIIDLVNRHEALKVAWRIGSTIDSNPDTSSRSVPYDPVLSRLEDEIDAALENLSESEDSSDSSDYDSDCDLDEVDLEEMSYEDLVELEDEMGYVSTGLSEDVIDQHLRRQIYQPVAPSVTVEKCCICQDGFAEENELGKIDCRHSFHFDCIKLWLQRKNECPVCKATALSV